MRDLYKHQLITQGITSVMGQAVNVRAPAPLMVEDDQGRPRGLAKAALCFSAMPLGDVQPEHGGCAWPGLTALVWDTFHPRNGSRNTMNHFT